MPTILERKKHGYATLTQVAKVAGVAPSTVSHILNGRLGSVASEQTRQRVTAVAQSLGYRPNLAARALRGGATKTLGFIDTVLEIEVVAARCSAFEDIARRGGYLTTMSFNHPEDPALEDRLIDSLRSRSVDGIVIVPVPFGQHTELRRCIQQGFPIVTLHGEPDLGPVCDVSIDFFAGGRLQGLHLIELGRSRVCQVTRSSSLPLVTRRLAGLQSAVEEAGGPPIITAMLRSDTAHFHRTDERDYHDLRRFFREHRGQFDAIVGLNDEFALCAIRAALDEGMRIPEDAAVIGFDDISAARFAAVPLTTVEFRPNAVAEKAFELLSALVEKRRNPANPSDMERAMLHPNLVIRESTIGKHLRSEGVNISGSV